jgi:hypothetical protein
MKSNTLFRTATAAAAAMAALTLSPTTAHAQAVFGFDCITNSAPQSCVDGESQLRMSVAQGTGNSVDFTFTNLSSLESSVTEIYFDDGTLLALATVTDSGPGVLFSQIGSGSPGNLPGGNSITPKFETTAGFVIDTGSGGNTRGVENKLDGDVQEFVTINFTLQPGRNYNDTLTALTGPLGDGLDLRVGLHVRGFNLPGGYGSSVSESFVNLSSPIPETDGLLLIGAGLLALGWTRSRRRAAQKRD